MKMRALLLDDSGPRLAELPRPVPGPDEALLRITCAGICSTDLELIRGYAGFSGVLGHEFTAVVEAAGDRSWVGRRVVGTINLGCRTCGECLAFGAEHCPQRTVLGIIGKDGVFADYATLPLANLLQIPDGLADAAAVFTEPLAAALRILDQLPVPPSARLAVVGPGRLGSLIAQVLALAGARPFVFGRRPESLELAKRWGFETGLAGEADADSFDLVVEATGNDAGLAESLRLVRPKGTLVLKSTFHGKASVDLTKVVVGEVRIVGSRCGPFAPALRLLERDAVDVASLVEGEYPLSRAPEALDHAARPGARKILLRPGT
jgi:threonine dehydrogenase-like Zn-dependent dehydrogenase